MHVANYIPLSLHTHRQEVVLHVRGEAEPTDGLHKFDILLGTNTAVVVSVTAGECLSSMLSRETLCGVRGVVRSVTLVTIEYSIKPKCQLLYTF